LVTSALPSSSPAPSLSSAVAAPATLRDLARRLDGRLIRPDDATYSSARLGYNPLYDGHRPAAIARCASVEDVQRCLEMASTSGIAVAARSGCHSFVGYSTPPNGLVIDLSRLAAFGPMPMGRSASVPVPGSPVCTHPLAGSVAACPVVHAPRSGSAG
jgi:hypothetical protein